MDIVDLHEHLHKVLKLYDCVPEGVSFEGGIVDLRGSNVGRSPSTYKVKLEFYSEEGIVDLINDLGVLHNVDGNKTIDDLLKQLKVTKILQE